MRRKSKLEGIADSVPRSGPVQKFLKDLFSLKQDTDEEGTIENIRNNVEFRSGNAWTLVFAIFIASIGLNINSPAVIIGAMLISPLMGPIVGAGFALAVNDFPLLQKSFRSLFTAVLLSILTSTLYFLISPLDGAQSEILARTKPTLFDVMIAIFGGASGIVAVSRREKGNAVPGVAIATALMPPLCTAGFALASANWRFFLGAFYLFSINSVFICLTTFVFVRYLKFPEVSYVDQFQRLRMRKLMILVGVITFLPSVFLAWTLIGEELFRSRAAQFVEQELRFRGTHVAEKKLNYSLRRKRITITLVGKKVNEELLGNVHSKLDTYGLAGTELEIQQTSFEEELEKKLSEKLSAQLNQNVTGRDALESRLKLLNAFVGQITDSGSLSEQIGKELQFSFPEVAQFYLTYLFERKSSVAPPAKKAAAEGELKESEAGTAAGGARSSGPTPASVDQSSSGDVNTAGRKQIALVKWKQRPGKVRRTKLEGFLRSRLQNPQLVLFEVN